MLKLSIIFLLFFILITKLNAQTNIDSLIDVVQNAQHDSVKTKALLDICWALKASEPKQAIEYGEKALNLSRKNGFKVLEATALKNIGTVYLFLDNYEKSENYLLAAIKIFQLNNNLKGVSGCYNNLGLVIERKGELDKAMEYYAKSLEIDIKLENKSGVAPSYTNIGNILQKQGNYKSSIEYYLKALKIQEELHNKVGVADAYNNIGALYEKQDVLDEALKNYQDALVLYIEINEKIKSAIALHNIGYILDKKRQYMEALEYYQQALNIREGFGDKAGAASTQLNIAQIYLEQKKYELAINNLLKAKEIYEEIGNKLGLLDTKISLSVYYLKINKPNEAINILTPLIDNEYVTASHLKSIYEILGETYAKKGIYNLAYNYQSKYIELKDSLENEENMNKIYQLQLNYEFDKKQKELEVIQEKQRINDVLELNKRKLIILILILCLIAFILVSTLVYRSYKIKKKDNLILEQQKRKIEEANEELTTYQEELISQKENLELQRKIVTQQRDQITEQKQKITDSIQYAKRIQNSVLPPEEQFSKIFSDHFILFRPKDIVSGDFYWLKESKNHICIAVADCTGHGVPGAFMSLLGISFLNEIIKSGYADSAEILNQTREKIKTTLHHQQMKTYSEPKDGIDIALCLIDKKKNKLQFSGAYNSLYILRNNTSETELLEFKGDKMPIGVHFKEDKPFTIHEIEIKPKDKFILFTDGFIDQFGGTYNRKFLPDRFKELILKTSNEKMDIQKKKLINKLESWMDDREQIDDILVVGFCF